MNKLLFAAAAAMSVWVASALTVYTPSSDPLVITGSMMTPVSSGTPTSVSGTGSSWSLDVADQGWSEGYAYVTLEVEPNTRVQVTSGTLQNTITLGSYNYYFGDLVIFASDVNPENAIEGQTTGGFGSVPAAGVMAWMSDAQYGDPANYATTLAANYAGFRYFGAENGFDSYRSAIGGYSSNVENFRAGGLAINGGAYAGWNELSATSMSNGSPARALTEILYPAGGGLNRALKDQTYSFDGAVYTSAGSANKYVTIMVRGGGGGGGSIRVNNLSLSFSAPGSMKITGTMMTASPALGSSYSAVVTGTGTNWSLDLGNGSTPEGYAYTTFMVPPNTKVQLTGGTLQNNISASSYFGDLVIFASSSNPKSAIAGKVAGPYGSNPPRGVMAWMSRAQYGSSSSPNYTSKAAINNAGYRYYGAYSGNGYDSYLQAIADYSSNVENFRDGGLEIDGGSYAGWNQVSGTLPYQSVRPLSEIQYVAGGWLNRPLKDQTYAFDGSVITPSGTDNMYVTVMLRGGGAVGSIVANDLTVSFTPVKTLLIKGSMMTPVSSGTPTTVTGYDAAWSLNVADQGWSEGYAYTTFVVAPNTKVQLTGGTLQNTIPFKGGYYFGDLVIFASAVNPSSAIAGITNGPTGSNPAPGVMAWMSDAQYGEPPNYATKAAANSAGYRYFGATDGFNSYRAAIGGYSCNVENFRDGGLAINGGVYVGWNDVSATMLAPSAIRPLTEIQFAAGGWLNRPLKDQTYAFDGSVYTGDGPDNMYVTVMVRGGCGGGGGAINVNDLTLTFSNADTLPLTIDRQTDQVVLTWPGDAYGMVLEQTDALAGSNTVWTTLSDTPTLQNGKWTVQKPVEANKRFYRLRLKTATAGSPVLL